MNDLTHSLAVLAQIATLYLLWQLIGQIFMLGFTIWKYFHALSQLRRVQELLKPYDKDSK